MGWHQLRWVFFSTEHCNDHHESRVIYQPHTTPTQHKEPITKRWTPLSHNQWRYPIGPFCPFPFWRFVVKWTNRCSHIWDTCKFFLQKRSRILSNNHVATKAWRNFHLTRECWGSWTVKSDTLSHSHGKKHVKRWVKYYTKPTVPHFTKRSQHLPRVVC